MKNRQKLFYMQTAFNTSKLSYCNRLKVGAVLVKNDQIISFGYNGTFKGQDNCCENSEGITKDNVLHAEENLLMKLVRSPETAVGGTIFITHQPCIYCAKLIANSGIDTLYYCYPYRCEKGLTLLKERQININKFTDLDVKEMNKLFGEMND